MVNRVRRGHLRRNPSYGSTQTVRITAEIEVRKPRQYWPISCPYHSRRFGSVEAALDAHHDSLKQFIQRNEAEVMAMTRYLRDTHLTLSPLSVSHSVESVQSPTVSDNRNPQRTESSNLAVLQRSEFCIPAGSSSSSRPPRTKNADGKCGLDVDKDTSNDYTQELVDQMGKSLEISDDDEDDDSDEDGAENELDLCLKI